MNKHTLDELAHDWWSISLRAVLALVAAAAIMLTPIPHAERLLRVFGAYMLIDGLIELAMAALATRHGEPWHKLVVDGVLGVIFGVLNLIGGGMPIQVRADLIALRTCLTGVVSILGARRLRAELPEALPQWLLIAAGIGSIVFSAVIVAGPRLEARLVGRWDWLASLYLVGFGALLLALAMRLHALSQAPTAPAAV
jgi:uncharacterized membrane protein HdeD (DUF308 family)